MRQVPGHDEHLQILSPRLSSTPEDCPSPHLSSPPSQSGRKPPQEAAGDGKRGADGTHLPAAPKRQGDLEASMDLLFQDLGQNPGSAPSLAVWPWVSYVTSGSVVTIQPSTNSKHVH